MLGGQSALYMPGLAISVGVAAFFLWFGIRRFRKTEKSFADLI
jgi:lipopolysaccharide transport system permease protein